MARVEQFQVELPGELNPADTTDEFLFLRDGDLEEIAPWAQDLIDTIVPRASEAWGEDLAAAPVAPWLTATKGPGGGMDWHAEGFGPEDLTLVAALNTVTGGSLLIGRDDPAVCEHRRGRCVLFPSDTPHSVEPLSEPEARFALAFLLRPRGR